ncbi:hypothetical protein B4U80_14381 [Leptotrombidium deliense]|uniref:C2H2-type domain-containing protein n=1 Tax=Leptotrombidium deliense TaxID=299467 RepID=A0A443RX40_9ACAR|nr:hypothetical protein B4U80_14381 [Leptotrombidium deliense]
MNAKSCSEVKRKVKFKNTTNFRKTLIKAEKYCKLEVKKENDGNKRNKTKANSYEYKGKPSINSPVYSKDNISKVRQIASNHFECKLCNKRFTARFSVLAHISGIHKKEKVFKCETCGERFRWSYALGAHLKAKLCTEVERKVKFERARKFTKCPIESKENHIEEQQLYIVAKNKTSDFLKKFMLRMQYKKQSFKQKKFDQYFL